MRKLVIAVFIFVIFFCESILTNTVQAETKPLSAKEATQGIGLTSFVDSVLKSSYWNKRLDIEDKKAKYRIALNQVSLTDFFRQDELSADAIATRNKISNITLDYLNKATVLNNTANQNKLRSDIENKYYQLAIAEINVDLQNDNLKLANDLYKTSKTKYESKVLDQRQYINSRLVYIQAQHSLSASQKELESIRAQFNNIVMVDIQQNTIVKKEIQKLDFSLPNVSKAIEMALSQRNEIIEAQFKSDLSELKRQLAQNMFGTDSVEYKETDFDLAQISLELDTIKKAIEVEVRDSLRNISKLDDDINNYKEEIKLSEDNLNLTLSVYKVLLTNIDEVKSAEKSVAQAKLNLYRAIADYNIAVQKFSVITGVGYEALNLGVN